MYSSFQSGSSFRGTQLYWLPDHSAYAYDTPHKSVDADGAPNAYHPDNIGLDYLANAGYPNTNWWKSVLVPDPDNPSRPYVQKGGEHAGYFVSMTSLRNPHGNVLHTETYVDSTHVPYIVLPTGFTDLEHVARPGDVGVAQHLTNGRSMTFIVGDTGGGSDAKLGEASIAFFIGLGGQNPNPRNGHGVPSGMIRYIVFPGSRRPGAGLWPRTNQDIHDQAEELLSHVPGLEGDA